MKNFDFIGKRKLFLLISIVLLAIGLLTNLIFGVEMDIEFTGGTLMTYTYTGTLDKEAVTELVHDDMPNAEVELEDGRLTITMSETVDVDTQTTFIDTLTKEFPDNNMVEESTKAPQASYGRTFFLKCIVAIVLASLFVVIFIGFRFRRIGGVSAAIMALLALLHDVLFAYFTFVVFRIPLNDNFVAVVLTILGYSLNDTIVIYDRIRENRRKLGKTSSITEIVNLSLNQSFTRTLNTSVCTFLAIGTVAVVALITSMDEILSFALPMSVGVVAGFYSSTFLCTPLWALWMEKNLVRQKDKKKSKAKGSKKKR